MAFSIIRVTNRTNSQITVLFNDNISVNITPANVSITSTISSVPDTTVTSVSIDEDEITVSFRPIFLGVKYLVKFFSTPNQDFETVNGEKISEDYHRNTIFITSPGESSDKVRDGMLDALPVVYETEQSTVRDLITSLSNQLNKVKDTAETVKASNYLSTLVEDEIITRGSGPVDKFANGGVYEVLRVGRTTSGANRNASLSLSQSRRISFITRSDTIVNTAIQNMGSDPISLQSIDVINERISDDPSSENYFDGLTIKVSKYPVTHLISATLKRDNAYFPYDINKFGYTLRNNKYDTENALINVTLEDNEIQLSLSSITGVLGGFLVPVPGDEIFVSYIYKRLGREVSNVSLYSTRQSIRESVSSTTTNFYLTYAPIILSNDTIPSSGGISFVNTIEYNGSAPFTTSHPSFLREIPFDLGKTPNRPGEFSVNYYTGQVLTFGEDSDNQGTGSNPPLATYYYRSTYVSDLDYTFNSDIDELAVNSTRILPDTEAKVSFKYEDTFVNGQDFRFLSHIEVLDERIENRLTSDFSIQTKNFPISDVFRIFNETTGEIYSVSRFNDTAVDFSGRTSPVQKVINRERASFDSVEHETLYISDDLTSSFGTRVLKIELENDSILDNNQRFVGSNFNTSVRFSDTDIFVNEMFYEDELFTSVGQNIDRLNTIGRYAIDHNNGIVYVAVSDDQGSDIGEVSYKYNFIRTRNDHILKVNNIYRSRILSEGNVETFIPSNISDALVEVSGIGMVGERFLNNNPTRPLLVGTYQNGEDGVSLSGSNLFSSNSAIFTEDDLGRTLLIGSSNSPPSEDAIIVGVVNEHQVVLNTTLSYTKTGRVWSILDLSEDAAKTITLENNIVSINNIYIVNQLSTLPSHELDGYYNINIDSFENNIITLGDANILKPGDAVIVDYNYGNIFIDYQYLHDEILASYEYGHNSLDWSLSSALEEGDEYFVTYKYGALREPLLLNFGALTQIPILTNFPYNFNREVYRSVVGGTLQSFIKGPTIPAIETLVESFTDVKPNITEYAFENWILGRDYLHLRDIKSNTNTMFDLGKFNNGITISSGQNIQVPALAHLRLDEGTMEVWVRPSWKGLANDSTITFDIFKDGYQDTSEVFIGFNADNPEEIPFSLSSSDSTVIGVPKNIGEQTGYFIWFDEFSNRWSLTWREFNDEIHEFTGTISTTGEFYDVVSEKNDDGYDLSEVTDLITSSTGTIEFSGQIDGYDLQNTYSMDGISFLSGDTHYIFDMASSEDENRLSLFKDGLGYLNFSIVDNGKNVYGSSRSYNISKDVSGWDTNESHHIAISWKLNSYNEKDEMHLFVDGQEVPNLFKYGGNPKATSLYDFGNVAEEIITSSAVVPTIGGNDGVSEAGSALFRSVSTNFESLGIEVGATLYILEDNDDGTLDDLTGGVYNVVGVGSNTLLLSRSLTLTLGDINFSVNPIIKEVSTPVNFQKFSIYTVDPDGNETELSTVDSSDPDYSISRGSYYKHYIKILNGVNTYDKVIIRTFGLIFRRCKEKIFVYENNDSKIRTGSPYPISLGDVDITKILLPKLLISVDNDKFSLLEDTLFASLGGDGYESLFRDGYVFEDGYVCQPSNQVRGRRLSIVLSGDNINYNEENKIIIKGETYSGESEETIVFYENGTKVTSQYWTNIESINIYVIPVDTSSHAGYMEVREYKPINESENNGDFAEITEYSNGIFTIEVYGSGGLPFYLGTCLYEIDYPTFLKIAVDDVPPTFFIGSDFAGSNGFDGIIDELRTLDTMYSDLRTGESSADGKNITTDFNKRRAFVEDTNTNLLLHFDNNLTNSAYYLDSFDSGFEVASSVNSSFGNAIKIPDNRPYIINNASNIFNNDEGTIEFWVSPLKDSKEDPNLHYYIDMSSVFEEELISSTKINITSSQRIREVVSVRLISDINNYGTNYFIGGAISNVDGKTITLGTPLPLQNAAVRITYIPLNSNGDRVSIFKDGSGFINFFMKASDVEHLISVPIDWERNTWHRVMIMWKTNSTNNIDRLRLFVDGSERGTIKYGTGLIYGTGVIWGQAEIRPGINRFIVDNIDLTDTFSKVYIGTDVYSSNSSMSRLDNIRFSDEQRLNSIRVIGNDILDTNYTSNSSLAQPSVSDTITTLLLNFDKNKIIIDDLITIINSESGIFRFKVDVIDSFNKVGTNEILRQLLVDLINVLKPAHTTAVTSFEE